MKIFAAKLKNIVAVGLIDIFITSVLLFNRYYPQYDHEHNNYNMVMAIVFLYV